MTEQELKAYARHVIEDHARDVEFISIFEMWEDYIEDTDIELSDEDGERVDKLISSAKVTISWGDD